MSTPVITIFVRHSPGCKYVGDEFTKRCNCRKHFRWTQDGKQYRNKAGTRSWAEAEENKRRLEDQLAGREPLAASTALLLSAAIKTFNDSKVAQGVKPRVRKMYARELKRLQAFSESKGILTAKQALTLENLEALRGTWSAVYKSSWSRQVVQKHLNHFLKYCYNAGWVDRVPKLSPIKVDQPETMPLTEKEYSKIIRKAEGRARAVIQLMRWSGLAVRDAATLRRSDVRRDKGIYRVIRKRTKTKEHLYIPIPAFAAEEVLALDSADYLFWNKQKETSSEYRHADYIGEGIRKVFDAAGVVSDGHMISHRLRATFAVDLLQKGVPLEHVSKLLGHRSVTTTERHYAKWIKWRQDYLDRVVSASWVQP